MHIIVDWHGMLQPGVSVLGRQILCQLKECCLALNDSSQLHSFYFVYCYSLLYLLIFTMHYFSLAIFSFG